MENIIVDDNQQHGNNELLLSLLRRLYYYDILNEINPLVPVHAANSRWSGHMHLHEPYAADQSSARSAWLKSAVAIQVLDAVWLARLL